ncbi:MAG: hypothetical protein KJ622_09075 [Alphaproteobacteria bacterium]|nr:hypothetical protein [Alphaproteobacteria bacterium]
MLFALSGMAIMTWAALVYGLIRPVRVVPVAEVSFWAPALLLPAFFLLPASFAVLRTSGTALIEQGLSSSNLLTIGIAGLSAMFILWNLIRYNRLSGLLHDRVLFPYYMTIGIAVCSTLWAIFPTYTIYRAIELAVMFTLVVLVLDRRDYARAFVTLHVLILGIWLLIQTPQIATSLASGIVFSSAKENLIPLLALSLLWFVWVYPRSTNFPLPVALLAIVAFIAAGSAATVATIPVFVTGAMIASPNLLIRGLGVLASIGYFALFLFLLFGLSHFPDLVDIIAAALQKPPTELIKATGRNELWPLFIEASQYRSFGSGFASERFLQLLVNLTAVQERLGQKEIFFGSAHNMVIGTWLATGWLGLATMGLCLGAALREAMRLDAPARRFVIPILFALVVNGMTVQGIFGEFNYHTVTWAAVLVMIRVRLRAGAAPAAVRAPVRSTTSGQRRQYA